MSKPIPTYNRAGSEPAPAKPKGRLKYKPMPQTVRELDSTGLFRAEFRNSAFIAHPKRGPEQDWSTCTLPHDVTNPRVMWATNLTRELAERVVQNWKARPAGGTFEYRIIRET